MKTRTGLPIATSILELLSTACGGSAMTTTTDPPDATSCQLTAHTTATAHVNSAGCAVLYGRKDPDGSHPTPDVAGGHTGVAADSPATAVYHYHANQQTSTAATSKGQMQWFLTTGTFKGTPAACAACN